MRNNDRDLRDRFAVMRQEDEAQAPDFSAVWREPAGHRRPRLRAKVAVVAIALVMCVTAILIPRLPRKAPGPDTVRPVTSISKWKAPTEFLLETPGRELLRTIPKIGNWQGNSAARGLGRKPFGKKRSLKKEES